MGDTLVSVGVVAGGGDDDTSMVKEDATGLDYDTTMSMIISAKTQAQLMTSTTADNPAASIVLEFNRLVPRKTINVIIDGAHSNHDKPVKLQGKAGDNLLQLLKRHNININAGSTSCGGEGICGTCMVQIVEGEESLNSVKTTKMGQNNGKRKACQTVIGADNREGTIRISL